jgi:hypothetical protein
MFGSATLYDEYFFGYISRKIRHIIDVTKGHFSAQALVSFKKCMPPSSSLLQGKHLPFSPSPLRLNIFRLFVNDINFH